MAKATSKGKYRSGSKDDSTFNVLKEIVLDLGESFSEGTDNLADICIDDSKEVKDKRIQYLKNETKAMVKEMASQTKRNIKRLKLKKIICDASYSLGCFAKKTMEAGENVVDMIELDGKMGLGSKRNGAKKDRVKVAKGQGSGKKKKTIKKAKKK